MTVIVGVRTNVGENAVVLAADKLSVHGKDDLPELVLALEESSRLPLSTVLEDIQRWGIDRITLKSTRKIRVNNGRALAHTGSTGKTDSKITQFLLDTEAFLQDDACLTELLVHAPLPEELVQKILEGYRANFDFQKRLGEYYLPEVRLLFDRAAVTKEELSEGSRKLAYWNRNYNTALSEYLFVAPFLESLRLFDLAITGRMDFQEYSANGCGRTEAYTYLRQELGTHRTIFGGESKVEREISIEDAVALATGAVQYTTSRNPFCRGLDYVIVRKEGIEEHFSDEHIDETVFLPTLIAEKIEKLHREIDRLALARDLYTSHTPLEE